MFFLLCLRLKVSGFGCQESIGVREIIVLFNWFDGTVCHTNQHSGCLSIDFRALQNESLNDPHAGCSPQIFNRKFLKKLAKTSPNILKTFYFT
jgi:hypothetical protein